MRTLILLVFTLFFGMNAFGQSVDVVKRDPNLLLNQFYFLKKDQPQLAKKTLDILLKEYPNNITGLKETGYWYLQNNDPRSALIYFEKAFELNSIDYQTALQIGYILSQLGDHSAAKEYFTKVSQSTDPALQQKAQLALTPYKPPPVASITTIYRQLFSATSTHSNVTIQQLPTTPSTTTNQPPAVIALIPPNQPATAPKESLLNQYYKLKKSNPKQALHILELLILQEPNNSIAFTEAGYSNLSLNNLKAAIYYFEKAYALTKNDKLALQIGYIAQTLKDNQLAQNYFAKAANSKNPAIKKIGLKALKIMLAMNKPTLPKLPIPKLLNSHLSYSDMLLNEFYAAQKAKNSEKSKQILHRLLIAYPDNLIALKELGYLYLSEKNPKKARPYFVCAFKLSHDYALAEQLGFIEDSLGNKASAYQYFKIATHSTDAKIRLQSNLAMTNLSGSQTRILPDPYFADFYTSPFYYSRFDLAVLPLIARTGVNFGDNNQAQVYLSLRYTRDDRSGTGGSLGQLPQIYEDDTAIFAMGARYQPFVNVPLYGYAEFGRSYDLIYRFRSRWRGDVRGGGFYMNSWGEKPTYTDTVHFPLKWIADAYGDASYYTRFQNDFITYGRFRPGIRLMEYHSSYLDAYVRTFIAGDTNHEFFNNYFEWGPGVKLTPYNRINFDILFETVRGYYFKVNSPDANPYGSHYNNKIILLEYYARF